MPEVSIIVPVYNVEKFLDRCVNSVLNQTFTDYECILVDDGSPDNSPKMCDEYAGKYDKFKIIHKKNGGLSDARNHGIAEAVGDYYFFLDSDDYLHPQTLEIMVEAIKKTDVGYVACKVKNTSLQQEEYPDLCLEKIVDKLETFSADEIFNDFNDIYLWKICPYACNKLYKKECFKELKYDTSMKLYEDEFIFLDITDKAKSVALVDAELYYYYMSENSLMRDKVQERFLLTLTSLQHLIDFMESKGIKKEVEILEFKWVMAYLDLYYRIKSESPEIMPKLMEYKPYFDIKQKSFMNNPRATRAYRAMLKLFKVSPSVSKKLYMQLRR